MRNLLALAISLFATVVLADPLEVTLKSGLSAGQIEVRLNNTGSEPVSILRWDTPFESELSSDVFRVDSVSKEWPLYQSAPYVGRIVKRASPRAEDYLTLRPGESITKLIALNDYYRFDKRGVSSVYFSGAIRYQMNDASNAPLEKGLYSQRSKPVAEFAIAELRSNDISINVYPGLTKRLLEPRYSNCSVPEQSDIVTAAQVAEQMSATTLTALNALRVEERMYSPRFNTWFGAYSPSRFDRVVSVFSNIDSALQGESIRFSCDCNNQGVYAYVYPSRPYDIYLCGAFWAANIDGADSRAGTIIHELSHFIVLGGTADHAYSQRGAQSLAQSAPEQAIDNAESYEYFVENTPDIAMVGEVSSPEPRQHTILELNQSVEGQLPEGSTDTYQVTDASRIELISLEGNADLFVYADTDLSTPICDSQLTVERDACEFFPQGTVYVAVQGYSNSKYVLQASTESESGRVADIQEAKIDIPVFRELRESEEHRYHFTGAEVVTLESLQGDVDLYVFNSMTFSNDSLICSSRAMVVNSTIDSCTLPSKNTTYYASVVGYTDAAYSLTAASMDANHNSVPAPTITDFGQLDAGASVNLDIVDGDYHTFEVQGVTSVSLNSLTGDTDLFVQTEAFELGVDQERLCELDAFSNDSRLDECLLPNSGRYVVVVYGFVGGSYRLSTVAQIPADDDSAEQTQVVSVVNPVPPGGTVAEVPVVPGDAGESEEIVDPGVGINMPTDAIDSSDSVVVQAGGQTPVDVDLNVPNRGSVATQTSSGGGVLSFLALLVLTLLLTGRWSEIHRNAGL